MPAVGRYYNNFGTCSATLIGPRYVVTAASCNRYSDEVTGLFYLNGEFRSVTRVYIFGPNAEPGQGVPPGNLNLNDDVALLEIDQEIPSARPMYISAGAPPVGSPSTMWGWGPTGCWSGGNGSGEGLRSFAFNFGTPTFQICDGDMGGPAMSADSFAIWGVASYTTSNGTVWGNVSRYKEDILTVIRMWQAGDASGIDGLEVGFRRNFYGPPYAITPNQTASSCKDLCNSRGVCKSFSFQRSTGSCEEFGASGDWVADPDFISGLVESGTEGSTRRQGFEYASVAIPPDGSNVVPAIRQCAKTCDDDSRCAAYSYGDRSGVCSLKEYGGIPVFDADSTSGVKRFFEYYTDRPGSDFRDFDLASPDVRVCRAACSADAGCYSFTYRNPTFTPGSSLQVTPAHCWLKTGSPYPITAVVEPNVGDSKRLISGNRFLLWNLRAQE